MTDRDESRLLEQLLNDDWDKDIIRTSWDAAQEIINDLADLKAEEEEDGIQRSQRFSIAIVVASAVQRERDRFNAPDIAARVERLMSQLRTVALEDFSPSSLLHDLERLHASLRSDDA